jgi:hypothetical protein
LEDATEDIYEEFHKLYISLCLSAKKEGYIQIEYVNSEEYFKELCEMNNYLFYVNSDLFFERV